MTFLHLLLICMLYRNARCQGPIVRTTLGDVQGFHKTDEASGIEYEGFFGIPYATPPVGNLRFAKTQPGQPWAGVLNATEFGSSCYQPYALSHIAREDQSEDCLLLNVWVPNSVDDALNRKLAVMFFIHGGGFSIGSGDFPAPSVGLRGLPIHGDVILVTINYRLDVLGFLSTGDANAAGNFGLWDSLEALQFVKNNIANFGGDPERITIFGQSAGGAMVTSLMFSPAATGVFHRVITHSGGAFMPWAFTRKRAEKVSYLAEQLGCASSDTAALVECLRNVNASALVDAAIPNPTVINYWALVTDGDFFPRPIDELLQDDNSGPYDFLGGCIATEGYVQAYDIDGINRTTPETYLRDTEVMLSAQFEKPAPVWQAAKHQYLWGAENNLTALKQGSWEMWHDSQFCAGTERIAIAQAKKGRTVYSYDYNHVTSDSPYPVGVHVEELLYLFGDPLLNMDIGEFLPEEEQLSRNMINYWSNFARTGNPNTGRATPVLWDQYDAVSKQYLEIKANMEESSRKTRKREKQYDFWNHVVATMEKSCQ